MAELIASGFVALPSGAVAAVKRAVIFADTDGDIELVAAVTGKKIRVLSWFINPHNTHILLRFESGAGGTALSGQMKAATGYPWIAPYDPHGHVETAAGQALSLEMSACTTTVQGFLTYIEV